MERFAGSGAIGAQDGKRLEASFNLPADIAIGRSNLTLYVADSRNHRIRMIKNNEVVTIAGDGTAGFKDGSGSSARFNEPYHIVITRIGGSVMYVADRRNNRVRRITLE